MRDVEASVAIDEGTAHVGRSTMAQAVDLRLACRYSTNRCIPANRRMDENSPCEERTLNSTPAPAFLALGLGTALRLADRPQLPGLLARQHIPARGGADDPAGKAMAGVRAQRLGGCAGTDSGRQLAAFAVAVTPRWRTGRSLFDAQDPDRHRGADGFTCAAHRRWRVVRMDPVVARRAARAGTGHRHVLHGARASRRHWPDGGRATAAERHLVEHCLAQRGPDHRASNRRRNHRCDGSRDRVRAHRRDVRGGHRVPVPSAQPEDRSDRPAPIDRGRHRRRVPLRGAGPYHPEAARRGVRGHDLRTADPAPAPAVPTGVGHRAGGAGLVVQLHGEWERSLAP
jgi:hypothetical protein